MFISPSPTSRDIEAPGFTSPGRPGLLYSLHSTWHVVGGWGGEQMDGMGAGRGTGRVDGWGEGGRMMVDGWVVEGGWMEDGRADGWEGVDG